MSAEIPELYALDPSIQALLNLKTFQDKFDVKEFITALSEKLIQQSNDDPGPFDPKPFIRTFESSLDTLISLRKELQKRTETLDQSAKKAEKEYSNKLVELNNGFDSVGKSFNNMEARISEVGRTVIRVGEQLESVHVARQRAQAAHDLVYYYNQFAKGDTTKLEALRKEGKEGRHQVAIILRRLSALAKEVDVRSSEQARDALDKYCEKFEKSILTMFDRSYRKGDPRMMAHCAQTLLEFNGGASCVQIYVNQHDFFISRARVQDANGIEKTSIWEVLPDPDASVPKREIGLANLFTEIRATVAQEAQIIQAVFPNPPFVMQTFLQRVFAQSIQQYLDLLLDKASSLSPLAFLRVLQLAHAQTSALTEDLKAHDLSSTSSLSRTLHLTGPSALDALDAREGRGSAVAVPIAVMLENALEEIFLRYTEGTKYLERETKTLLDLYAGYLEKFVKYHATVGRAKATGGLLDRMVDRLASASGSSLSSGTSGTAAAAFMKFSGMASLTSSSIPTSTAPPPTPTTGTGGGIPVPEDIPTEKDGALSIDVSEKMLKWHAEAIGRCVELSPSADLAKNAFALLRVLADALGTGYIETAIETASLRLDGRDARLEPDLSALQVIKTVDLICHLWQQYISIALIPLASSSVTIRREMVIFNNQTASRIEGAANALEQKVIDAIITWLSTQLAKQKKTDFKPKNDELSFARVNTEPCVSCCDSLDRVKDVAKENLSGKNLESFLTEVGVTFHNLLLDHLKKFPVSATGGLMLAKDLKSYQDAIATFQMPALDERFEFIRQLGNIWLVRPEVLKSYLTEDYLGKVDTKLLRPYLAQRTDWGQFAYDDGEGDGEKVAPGEAEAKGLRERLGMGKLSAMMRELDGLRGSGTSSPGGRVTTPASARTPIGNPATNFIPAFALGSMY